MFKNTASQKLTVYAFADGSHASLSAGQVVTGDAANITLKIEQDDDGTQSASNDTNPTEVEDGQYRFDLTQAETNGNKLTFYPESSTTGVQVIALPSNVIYTRPPNFSVLSIESDGDLTQVNLVDALTSAALNQMRQINQTLVINSGIDDKFNIRIDQGYAYQNANENALDWLSITADEWIDLTGADIRFSMTRCNYDPVYYAGSVITATGSQKVRVELTELQTWALAPGRWEYELFAEINSFKYPMGRRGYVDVIASIPTTTTTTTTTTA